MIRPFTLVCMLMAGASGLYLYQTKHRAQVLDRDIVRTVKQTEQARERIGMLRAEWMLLNQPERLAELAKLHTSLQPIPPGQYVAVNDLGSRLPPPGPVPTLQPTDMEPEPAGAAVMAQTAPSSRPSRPVQVAASSPPRPEPKPLAEPDPKPASAPHATRPAPVQLAAAAEPKPARETSRDAGHEPARVPVRHEPARARTVLAPIVPAAAAVAPGTIGESVLRTMRARAGGYAAPAPAPAYVQPAYAPATPSYTPVYAPAVAGSLLGSGVRGALPPPVPFAAR